MYVCIYIPSPHKKVPLLFGHCPGIHDILLYWPLFSLWDLQRKEKCEGTKKQSGVKSVCVSLASVSLLSLSLSLSLSVCVCVCVLGTHLANVFVYVCLASYDLLKQPHLSPHTVNQQEAPNTAG